MAEYALVKHDDIPMTNAGLRRMLEGYPGNAFRSIDNFNYQKSDMGFTLFESLNKSGKSVQVYGDAIHDIFPRQCNLSN